MSRKDFDAISKAAHAIADKQARRAFVAAILPHLWRSNPSFNEERFIAACGL